MGKFFGKGNTHQYFEGWYLKQQNDKEIVALIPAFHANDRGEASASLQVITDTQAYSIKLHAHSFLADRKNLVVRLDQCIFSKFGCKLDVKSATCNISGTLRFGPFVCPAYDIMGPFSVMPFMECRHSVFSLFHRVDGQLTINGRSFLFENSSGYMEGDRGISFPARYIWTQCSSDRNSIMLSVADIPFGCFHFVGCIGFIYWNGVEHRIATYCGVKLLHVSNDMICSDRASLC